MLHVFGFSFTIKCVFFPISYLLFVVALCVIIMLTICNTLRLHKIVHANDTECHFVLIISLFVVFFRDFFSLFCFLCFYLRDYLLKSKAYIIDCVHKQFDCKLKERKKNSATKQRTEKWIDTMQWRCRLIVLSISFMALHYFINAFVFVSLFFHHLMIVGAVVFMFQLCDSFVARETHSCALQVCVSV